MIGLDTALVRKVVSNGERLDGRMKDEYRDVSVKTNIVSSAEGSARVSIGNTMVIAGVKMGIVEPYPDSLDEGTLMVAVEFIPFADPLFEPGPPNVESIEVARVVDRAIRESKAIDTKKLCIKEGEKVWSVSVDIDVINNDGNLIDASSIAAVAALATAKFPLVDENGKVVWGKKTDKSLPVNGLPLCTTFVKINGTTLLDPTAAEFAALDARLTIGTLDDGKLCALQKNGMGGLTLDEIDQMVAAAEEKAEEIRGKIRASI